MNRPPLLRPALALMALAWACSTPAAPPRAGTAARAATPSGAAAAPLPHLVAAAADLPAAVPASAPHGACIDEDNFSRQLLPNLPPEGGTAGTAALPPRQALARLVQDVMTRNQGVAAGRLLAEASLQDVQEATAMKAPQASLTGTLAPALVSSGSSGGSSSGAQLQAGVGITVTQNLYDGGRLDRTIDWRRWQAEASRMGQLSNQEQLALSATSVALERSRYRMQVAIWNQNVRKMGCLVQALETIYAADRGRLSELVQARKQLQQAELQQAQSVSQVRQAEARLRRMAGEALPPIDGLSTLLLSMPELPVLLSAAERSHDIAAMDASASAMREAARVVEAGTRPQVSWMFGANAGAAGGSSSSHSAALSAGLSLSIPLMNSAVDHTLQAARRRADAALLQRADVLEQKRQRILDVYEQAGAAFDRLRRISGVLKDSDQLRNFTLQQWQQLGRRSLFDVISAESEHYGLRVQYINALHDGQQMNATLASMSGGMLDWLQGPPDAPLSPVIGPVGAARAVPPAPAPEPTAAASPAAPVAAQAANAAPPVPASPAAPMSGWGAPATGSTPAVGHAPDSPAALAPPAAPAAPATPVASSEKAWAPVVTAVPRAAARPDDRPAAPPATARVRPQGAAPVRAAAPAQAQAQARVPARPEPAEARAPARPELAEVRAPARPAAATAPPAAPAAPAEEPHGDDAPAVPVLAAHTPEPTADSAPAR